MECPLCHNGFLGTCKYCRNQHICLAVIPHLSPPEKNQTRTCKLKYALSGRKIWRNKTTKWFMLGDIALWIHITDFISYITICFIASVQSLSLFLLFATPWTAAHQTSLSFTISWSMLKLMSIELVMPSNHLIFCHPLLLVPSIYPHMRVFSSESVLRIRWPKYWSFTFIIW